MTKKVQLTDTENLAAGALGGIMETLIQMPLITYKVCVQEGRPLPTGLGWYRGVGAAAGSLAPITAVQVAANGVLERMVTGGDRKLNDAEKIITAMGAGSISALLYSPVDLLVIQQQKLNLGLWPTISHISREHGALMLMRGFNACVVREAIYTAGYLGIAPIAKDQLQANYEYWKQNDLGAAIVGSCIGGTIAAMLTHPVDTAKTCMQGDLEGANYKNARSAVPQIHEKGGIGALYKGGLARTARLCGAFFIINNVIDMASKLKGSYFA
ncbi:hypothetical protein CYMTET_52197 [Cymbomonas tetramitiformis]|uniref:Mitochondrial carrier protein n=1 Tax=Cymbomonas tetramitiformis TaxID=36881 RepID=A0AAE0BJL8_9CHLO|nr:hypothetical protein CYMTET_52197 [Cymbomonas tetramitiformis]